MPSYFLWKCTDKSFTHEIYDLINNMRTPLTRVEKIKDLSVWLNEKLI